jgi:hypothetical protein
MCRIVLKNKKSHKNLIYVQSSSQFWICGVVDLDLYDVPTYEFVTVSLIDQTGKFVKTFDQFQLGSLLTSIDGTLSFSISSMPTCQNSSSKLFLLLVQFDIETESGQQTSLAYVSTPFVSFGKAPKSSCKSSEKSVFRFDVACASSTARESFIARGAVVTELITSNQDVLAKGNYLTHYIGDVLMENEDIIAGLVKQVRRVDSDEVSVRTGHSRDRPDSFDPRSDQNDTYSSKQRKRAVKSTKVMSTTVVFEKGFCNRYQKPQDLFAEFVRDVCAEFFVRWEDSPLFERYVRYRGL